MSETAEQQPAEPAVERVQIDALVLEQTRVAAAKRRLAAEEERCELIEASYVQARREIAALRQMVTDRDGEIEELRRQLDPAPEPKRD